MKQAEINRALRLAKKTDFGYRRGPSGCYGTYFKLTKSIGIKIYQRDSAWSNRRARALKTSRGWKLASNAFKMMRKVAKHGIAPEGYALIQVTYKDEIRPGLVMQHIEGRHKQPHPDVYEALEKRMKKLRVTHNDMGDCNWKVMKDGKIVLIDWDFGRVQKRKRRKR